MLRTLTAPRLARLAVIVVPFAALLAAACEHNAGTGLSVGGQLLAITVTPNPVTLPTSALQQFVAVGTDVNGAVVPITPTPLTWTAVATPPGGTINGGSGIFTAGTTVGTFTGTVRACNGSRIICGFATVTVANLVIGPPLGTAVTYGILAGSAVTCASPPGTINADVGVSPGSATTGFGPGLCTITGTTNAANALSAQAQVDLTATYNALVAYTCTTAIVADLGGTTITPGVYCSGSSVGVTGTLTLDGGGNANALFVIKAGSTLTTAGPAGNIALINGTQAKNVWWQVTSSATLGTGTTFRGNIVALQSITLAGTDTLIGRALARNGSVALSGTNDSITLP